MLNLSQATNTALNHLYLELPQQHLKDVHQHHSSYANDVARRNACINELCLQALTEWLSSELDLPPETITVWPNQLALPSMWDVVNGTALQLGQTRLVLIPSEANTLDEFCVPFEWVDIPTWAAPYYLAVQVNLEEDTEWLRIWGFATHQQVKAGDQDPVRRIYSLPRQDLTESLNVLWVAQELGLVTPPEVTALPPLSPDRAAQLIAQLGQPTLYSPRLEVPFATWAALLEHDNWRQQLYERRQQVAMSPILSTSPSDQPTMSAIVNLQHWLRQTIAEHWQTVELLLAPVELSPARGRVQAEEDIAQNAIAAAIRLLQTSSSEPIRRQAAGMLGEIGAGHPEAVTSLVELLQQTEDEETRWQVALSLGKLDPAHPLAGVRKARILDLDSQPDVPTIVLSVAILPKADDRIGVWLQLQPVDQRVKLPPHLQLSVLSESGETRLATEARQDEQGQGQDQAIELRFSPPVAAHFQVRVTLGSTSVTADFVA